MPICQTPRPGQHVAPALFVHMAPSYDRYVCLLCQENFGRLLWAQPSMWLGRVRILRAVARAPCPCTLPDSQTGHGDRQEAKSRASCVLTKGFHATLAIGSQNRPRLFDLDIRNPSSLPRHPSQCRRTCHSLTCDADAAEAGRRKSAIYCRPKRRPEALCKQPLHSDSTSM